MAQEATPLSPQEEQQFQAWATRNKISDVDHPQSFYDYRGFWKETSGASVRYGVDHFPDTYKQHGHPTFSIESKYSRGPDDGGRWEGGRYVPQQAEVVIVGQDGTEHVFPAGFDPKRAAQIVRGPSDPSRARTLEGTHIRLAQKPQEPVRDAVTGAAKSLFGTVATLTGPISRRVLGQTPEQYAAAVQDASAPIGTAQKVGQVAEQIGEFVLPAAGISKGLQAAQVAARVRALGLARVPARLLASAVEGTLQGVTATGVATAQGADNAGTVGAISAVAPIVAQSVKFLAPAIQAGAKQQLARVLATGLEDRGPMVDYALKTGKAVNSSMQRSTDIVRTAAGELLDLPVQAGWGKWQTTLAERTGQATQTLKGALNGQLGDVPIQKQPIVQAFDDLIDTTTRHFAQVSAGGFRQVPFDEPLMGELTALRDTLAEYHDTIQTRHLVDIKRVWDKTVFTLSTSGKVGVSPDSLTSTAMKDAAYAGANSIRAVLADQNPSVAKLDEVVAHAIRLEDLVVKLHAANPSMSASTRSVVTALGATAGAVTGGSTMGAGMTGHILGAHLGGVAANMITRLVESPLWQTLPSQAKSRLATAIQAGAGDDVRTILLPFVARSIANEPTR